MSGPRERRRPLRKRIARERTQAIEGSLHGPGAHEAVQHVGGTQAEAHARGCGCVVVRHDVTDTTNQRRRSASPQLLDEEPRLDSDRARRGAEPAAGAGVDTLVVIEPFELADT